MTKVINVIDKVSDLCTQQGLTLKKIYNDGKDYFVYAPPKDAGVRDAADGTYLFINNKLKQFIPSQDFDLYDRVVKEENIIYE